MGMTQVVACRTDAGLFGDLVLVIDIYRIEFDGRGRWFLREILKDRTDCPTWTAPSSPEINDHGLITAYLISEQERASSRAEWRPGDIGCLRFV